MTYRKSLSKDRDEELKCNNPEFYLRVEELFKEEKSCRQNTSCSVSILSQLLPPPVIERHKDGISVTGLPISSPLRHVLKPRTETKSVSSESGKAEYSHVKVGTDVSAAETRLHCLGPLPGAKPGNVHPPAPSLHFCFCKGWLSRFRIVQRPFGICL
ncbi:hypothetical protein GOODEAATRI_027276 [Goodea atripinnis]|uniref:Uncharacterized protein n=1 Tax=Goodea atripinnis TaxID=208336 RepID=A0ABV0NYL3_9TELE